jgi:putative transposase
MDLYRTSAHTRFDIKYHFVWTTKYRKRVLGGTVGVRLRELVREVCRANDLEILRGYVGKDHVHLLVSAPPNISASKIMQYVKGKSSRKLLMEFRHLNRAFWGRHLWARGFFVATSGNVTDEVIEEYIRLQNEEPAADDATFRVEEAPDEPKDFSP